MIFFIIIISHLPIEMKDKTRLMVITGLDISYLNITRNKHTHTHTCSFFKDFGHYTQPLTLFLTSPNPLTLILNLT